MEAPKIRLSPAESQLMKDAGIILTKNAVLEKIKALLQSVEKQQLQASSHDDDEAFAIPPKISRGENYLGLPYLILDYPRLSADAGLYFIRTMFWWGNFFSTTLHLSGSFADGRRERIAAAYPFLCEHSFSFGTDPWAHHFEAGNYQLIKDFSAEGFAAACVKAAHIKIARTVSLDEWPLAEERLMEQWKWLLAIAG
jgi:hypothetical protein